MTGDFLLPLLILVILVIIGLTIWLALTLSRKTSGNRTTGSNSNKSARNASVTPNSLLSVRQDERGLWEVRVLNVPYQRLGEVPDPKVRKQVVDAIRIVAAFGREYITRQQKETSNRPAETAAPTTPVSPPDVTSRLRRPAAPPRLMPQIDLAKEIGEILREMQKQRSSLAKRSIGLQNASDGGVRFVVDGKTYTTVSEIPDLEVQALIRDATREWEQQ